MKIQFRLILGLSLLSGCGGDDTTGGGTSGTAGSGGTASGTSTSNGTSNGTSSGTSSGTASGTGTSSSGGTASGTGGLCEGFDDEVGPSVPVKITNTSNAPVYVGGDTCNMTIQPGLIDQATDDAVPGLTDCATCEMAVQGNCACPGPPCFLTAGLRLDPGASVDLTVSATRYDTREIPAECPGSQLCGPTCQQAAPLPDGGYLVRIQAATAVMCQGQPCDCMPDQTGTCWVEMEGGLVNPMDYDGSFTMPGPAPVEIMVP